MRYLESAVTLRLDAERCNGCGMCVTVCPHAVFAIVDRRATLADRGACMECGACARNCPQGALGVRSGTGCAAGVLAGWMAGKGASCDCSGDSDACC